MFERHESHHVEDAFRRLLKSLPDSKSERELRVLCRIIQEEEIAEEKKLERFENAQHKAQVTQPVSKKQRVLSNDLEDMKDVVES